MTIRLATLIARRDVAQHIPAMVVVLALIFLSVQPVQAQATREAFTDSLLARMTLAEKLGQLNQVPSAWSDTGPTAREGGLDEIRAGLVGSFLGMWQARSTREVQRVAVEESRLGIPLVFMYDVIHGFRTIFPVPLGEAATWDTAAVRHNARIAAREAAAHGIHLTFAPMVDVSREPRWGRIVEGAGEDPFLGSAMAAARVRGFQGDDLAADSTVAACAKHFAGYGAAEGGRDYDAAQIPPRLLSDVYLPPFEAAIDAGVACVMAAFNEIDGVPMHAHETLLRGYLREWLGFRRHRHQRLHGRAGVDGARHRRDESRGGPQGTRGGRGHRHGEPDLRGQRRRGGRGGAARRGARR